MTRPGVLIGAIAGACLALGLLVVVLDDDDGGEGGGREPGERELVEEAAPDRASDELRRYAKRQVELRRRQQQAQAAQARPASFRLYVRAADVTVDGAIRSDDELGRMFLHLGARSPDAELVVDFAPDVAWPRVVWVMDQARTAGLTNLRIAR